MAEKVNIKVADNGYRSIQGDLVDAAAADYRKHALLEGIPLSKRTPHVTILGKEEAEMVETSLKMHLFDELQLSDEDIHICGLGGNPKAGMFWICVLIPKVDRCRHAAGLPIKHLHITLSEKDNQKVDKGLASLLDSSSLVTLNAAQSNAAAQSYYDSQSSEDALRMAIQAFKLDPSSKHAWTLGECATQAGYGDLAKCAYARCYDTVLESGNSKSLAVKKACVQKIASCWATLVAGPCYSHDTVIEEDLFRQVGVQWSQELRSAILQHSFDSGALPYSQSPGTYSRQMVLLPDKSIHRMQRFLSWILPFRLAACAEPRDVKDIQGFAALGITHVITATKERQLPSAWFASTGLINSYIPIEDQCPAESTDFDTFLRIMVESNQTDTFVVHCACVFFAEYTIKQLKYAYRGGKGRAGSLLAAYLAAFGMEQIPKNLADDWHYPAMSATQAIELVRTMRPHSVETVQQEEAVARWVKMASKRNSPVPKQPERLPPSKVALSGALPQWIRLVVLVGLPASGKSWFRMHAAARCKKVDTVSSDEDGIREVVSAVSKRSASFAQGRTLIVDRCNINIAARKEILNLASNWADAKSTIAIHFRLPKEVAIARAEYRLDHPTIKPSAAANVISGFDSQLDEVELREGFGSVVRISSFEASCDILRQLFPKCDLLKFPRTSHLIDTGSATKDDIIAGFNCKDDPAALEWVITEKVDGDRQFKSLDKWVDKHRESLYAILDRDKDFPERYILYGEWLAAVHATEYTKLPGLFLAFDLYDRLSDQWADRNSLEGLLKGSKIPPTPVIYRGKALSESALLKMAQRQSSFTDGPAEGIYVKRESGGIVKSRGKVVRPNFIPGDEHWRKQPLKFNKVIDSSNAF